MKLAFGIALGIVLGVLLASIILWHSPVTLYCPTEDSCRASYHDGTWWVIQENP